MQALLKVTQKGQITIPKWIRDALNIKKHNTVKITLDERNKKASLEKQLDLVDMAGFLKVDPKLLKKYPVDKTRELMGEHYGKWAKKSGRI